MPLRRLDELSTVATGLDHPEAVAWHDGRLWCGTEGGDLLAIDPHEGSVEVAARTGGLLLGIAFDGRGRCWACDSDRGRLLRIVPGGEVETVIEAVEGRRLQSPNFPAFDEHGTLWVTESGRFDHDDGFLFSVAPDGSAAVADDELWSFPNGLAFSVDGETLYVVESSRPRVSALRLVDRSCTSVELPGTVPDGLAVDSAGVVYVSCWRPHRVYRWVPSERPEVLLDDPYATRLATATNLCFGGADLRTLFIAGIGGHVINSLPSDVAGHPLPRPI